VALAAAVALSACSGSPSPSAEAATVPSTVAVATLASSTTTEPSTTVPATEPVTTEPATTVAPTTVAPTTVPADPDYVGVFPEPLRAVGTGNGTETAKIQLRLLQLGFWVNGADGTYGLTTKQAVMAFQKYIGIQPATGSVDDATAAYLTNLEWRAKGRAETGRVVEVDKARQLLFFSTDGRTQWVFNTSTGSGEVYTEEDKNSPGVTITDVADTPDGKFKVNRERPEGWWEGDLGEIYRPKYFNGGIAVHGSNSVPNYPASHGCVRLTVPAMDFVWDQNLMPKGTTVWVHS
jgi:lipoprotein-anchoring transpeptidase ErfK/SrfK